MNHRHCMIDPVTSKTVLFMKAKTNFGNTMKMCKCGPNTICDFCKISGHCIHECYAMIQVKKQRKERQAGIGHSGQAKDKQNANKTTSSGDSSPSRQNNKTEHKDKASPATNIDPVYTTADCSWNADMGASSNMTPHQ